MVISEIVWMVAFVVVLIIVSIGVMVVSLMSPMVAQYYQYWLRPAKSFPAKPNPNIRTIPPHLPIKTSKQLTSSFSRVIWWLHKLETRTSLLSSSDNGEIFTAGHELYDRREANIKRKSEVCYKTQSG